MIKPTGILPEEFEQLPIIHFHCVWVKASVGPLGFAQTGSAGFQHSTCIFYYMVDNMLHL